MRSGPVIRQMASSSIGHSPRCVTGLPSNEVREINVKHEPAAPVSPRASSFGTLPALCAALTLLLSILLLIHAKGLNGPYYFQWPWQHLGPVRSAGAVCVLGIGALAVATICGRRMPFWLALVLLTLTSSGLRLGVIAMSAREDPLDYAREAVLHPGTGSFVTVALALSTSEWNLEEYPEMTRFFPAHASNKPPGPTLYWLALFRTFADQTLALNVGVILVSLLGALTAPLTVIWARQLGAAREAALIVGGVLTLLPGTFVFFPLFDAVYASLAMCLVVTWTQTLLKRSIAWACVFGVVLAGTLVFSFQILPIGALLALETFFLLEGSLLVRLRQAFVSAIVSLATCLVLQLLLKAAVGYDAVHMFRAALSNQQALMAKYGAAQRPYPLSIPWDLYDFALGCGYVAMVIGLWALARSSRKHSADFLTRQARWTVWSGAALVTLIAAAGMIPGETARVWNFLYPLVALPAGCFIASAPGRQRLIFLICQFILLCVMVHAMVFISVKY